MPYNIVSDLLPTRNPAFDDDVELPVLCLPVRGLDGRCVWFEAHVQCDVLRGGRDHVIVGDTAVYTPTLARNVT